MQKCALFVTSVTVLVKLNLGDRQVLEVIGLLTTELTVGWWIRVRGRQVSREHRARDAPAHRA